MPVLVPARGAAGFRNLSTGGIAEFIVLGPFAQGDILSEVFVSLVLMGDAGGHTGIFNAAVTGSQDATEANFSSGTPLLASSDVQEGGALAVRAVVIQSAVSTYRFFPGIRFDTGAQWVIVRGNFTGNATSAALFVSCKIMRVVEG